MEIHELVLSPEELKEIASMLGAEARKIDEPAVFRYAQVSSQSKTFHRNREKDSQEIAIGFNKELLESRRYFDVQNTVLPTKQNIEYLQTARDMNEFRYPFTPKGLPLSDKEIEDIRTLPEKLDFYDKELKQIAQECQDALTWRLLFVIQRVIANSNGGCAIESIPLYAVNFTKGILPLTMYREARAITESDKDIEDLTEMIKFMPDPTLEQRIRSSETFTEAFKAADKLYPLKHGSLEAAGIKPRTLYDVVVLNGVPIHEIFGHHFEEPIGQIVSGQEAIFKTGMDVQRPNFVMKDDTQQTASGYKLQGFTNFDAYGRQRKASVHIIDGKVKDFLGSEYADLENWKTYSGEEQPRATGHAVQYTQGIFPQPRMSCTVLDGKTEDIDFKGKVIIVPDEGYTRTEDRSYALMSAECYVIDKNGEPRRVIPLKITGGIFQALNNMDLLEDWTCVSGFCGKSNPLDPKNRYIRSNAPVSKYCRNQVWYGQQIQSKAIREDHLRILIKH